MSDFSTLSPLSDAELDAVTGGVAVGSPSSTDFSVHVRIDQNANGGFSLAAGGDGGNARAEGLLVGGTATGGVGGNATSSTGGAGGTNGITVTV